MSPLRLLAPCIGFMLMWSGLRIASGSCVTVESMMFGGLVFDSSTVGMDECRPSGVGVAEEMVTRCICSESDESWDADWPIADEARDCER